MNTSDATNELFSWQAAARVTITGAQPATFLQGYLTNDMEALAEGDVARAALCNLKGRVVANGWVYRAADAICWIVHQTLAARAVEVLTPYARFSRCSVTVDDSPVVVTAAAGLGPLVEGWYLADPGDLSGAADLPAADAELMRALIAAPYAWVSAATSDMFLPQMLGLEQAGAIDFHKGCYLGQEVVARAQFRGAVKRKLVTTEWQGSPPEPGAKLADQGVVIAVATSAENSAQGPMLTVM